MHHFKDTDKPRHNKDEQHRHDDAHDENQHQWINHGADDGALQLLGPLEKIHQPLKHHVQNTASFAGLDHVDIEAVEDFRVFGKRLGKRFAAAHITKHFPGDVFEHFIFRNFYDHGKPAVKRQARPDQGRKLLRE